MIERLPKFFYANETIVSLSGIHNISWPVNKISESVLTNLRFADNSAGHGPANETQNMETKSNRVMAIWLQEGDEGWSISRVKTSEIQSQNNA